jgi:hypothetical protein
MTHKAEGRLQNRTISIINFPKRDRMALDSIKASSLIKFSLLQKSTGISPKRCLN